MAQSEAVKSHAEKLEEIREQDRLITEEFAYLATQEERDNFIALSDEEKAEICFAMWSSDIMGVAYPPRHENRKCNDNTVLMDKTAFPERDEFDTVSEFKSARKAYKSACIEAKALCSSCPLIAECLKSATIVGGRREGKISQEESQVWGGTLPKERQPIHELIVELWEDDLNNGYSTLPYLDGEFQPEIANIKELI